MSSKRKRKKPEPVPTPYRAEQICKALKDIRKNTNRLHLRKWCIDNELPPDTFRVWARGDQNVSIYYLIKLYQATKDIRFLYTAEERQVFLEIPRYKRTEFPSEDVWPIWFESDDTEKNLPFEEKGDEEEDKILMANAKDVSIYDIFKAIDDLHIYVEGVIQKETIDENDLIFFSYVYMAMQVVIIRLNIVIDDESQHSEIIENCIEISEKIANEFCKDQNLQDDGTYLSQTTNLLIILVALNNIVITMIEMNTYYRRHQDFPYFGAKTILGILKGKKLIIPEWFKDWESAIKLSDALKS